MHAITTTMYIAGELTAAHFNVTGSLTVFLILVYSLILAWVFVRRVECRILVIDICKTTLIDPHILY